MFGKKTLSSIVKQFDKMATDLDALVEANHSESNKLDDEISELVERQNKIELEALRAITIRDKISSLTSVDTDPA